ncbi:MAG: DUF3696 domain-containing protein [Bacteroidetes bacterium]|nr:DUF3696 domain-containing protein [Bacteroidota bacterium]
MIERKTNDVLIEVSETFSGEGSTTNTKIKRKVDLKKLWIILQRSHKAITELRETTELLESAFDQIGIAFNWGEQYETQNHFSKELNELITKRNIILSKSPWLRSHRIFPNDSFTDGHLYYMNVDDLNMIGKNRAFTDTTINNYLFVYKIESLEELKQFYPNLPEDEANELMLDYVEAKNYIKANALPGEDTITETVRRWELEEIENYISQNENDSKFSPVNLFENLLYRIKQYSISDYILRFKNQPDKTLVGNKHLEKLRKNGRLVLHNNGELSTNCPDYSIRDYFLEGFLYEGILQMSIALQNSLNIDFVPSIRNKVDRVYRNTPQDSFFHDALYQMMGIRLSQKAGAFLNKYIAFFGIAEKVKIESSPDSSFSQITLVSNGKEINLADVGYGYSQILPIILKLALLIHDSEPADKQPNVIYINMRNHDFFPSLIIIEEPETNLHPALQSKLADMFIECYKEYNIQFIIETHSEYLIRKLQYLTAKKEINPDFTQIYYFHPPDAVPKGEKQVRKINILKDGRLSADFGTGFFDETTKLIESIWEARNLN